MVLLALPLFAPHSGQHVPNTSDIISLNELAVQKKLPPGHLHHRLVLNARARAFLQHRIAKYLFDSGTSGMHDVVVEPSY